MRNLHQPLIAAVIIIIYCVSSTDLQPGQGLLMTLMVTLLGSAPVHLARAAIADICPAPPGCGGAELGSPSPSLDAVLSAGLRR